MVQEYVTENKTELRYVFIGRKKILTSEFHFHILFLSQPQIRICQLAITPHLINVIDKL